jgi:PTS system nitrogen regulatory IIA component
MFFLVLGVWCLEFCFMYLNVIQLAESLGVEENVVEVWVRNDGLPCIQDRGRLVFDRAQVVAWAAGRGLAAKAGFLAPERIVPAPAGKLAALLRTGGIWRDVPASGVTAILERVVTALPGATPAVRQLLVQRLRSSDGVTWSPVGGGLALPHLRTPVALGRDAATLTLLLLRDAFPLQEPPPDEVPVMRMIFFIASSPRVHLEMFGRSLRLAPGECGRLQRVRSRRQRPQYRWLGH